MQGQTQEIMAARAGGGNWDAFTLPLDTVRQAAAEWEQQLAGIRRPWLCWNVSARWSLLQQRLVEHVGWTPVVGFDPRVGAPPLRPGAVVIDFNRHLQLPVLKPMFPLEFVFLFADRLAFWHSDLLCRLSTMDYIAGVVNRLQDGQTAAVLDRGGWQNLFRPGKHRYWELVGCTTRGASESQFRNAAGWWRHPERHVNCTDPAERRRRENRHWEHGTGIMYWKRHYGGTVLNIDRRRVEEGHCTSIGNPHYKRLSPKQYVRNLSADLDANFDVELVARHLGLGDLL